MARLLLALALVPYALWLTFAYRYHFLDGVNLAFHEAGHLFFAFGGQTLAVLGGTLGQLIFPAAAAVHFWIRNERAETAVCGVWLGESVMYAAEYLADARVQALPLVGGHIHDWNWMLSRWGVLEYAETLGGFLHGVGSLVVLGATFWALRSALDRQPVEAENP